MVEKKSQLDQFYTNPEIAKCCYNSIFQFYIEKEFDLFLEPSAGNGAFLKLFPKNKRIGLDLEPKLDEIIQYNFFDYIPPKDKKIITIGNPPFGRICSIAINFFNKAAQFSDLICFIIPRTFNKKSLQDKLDLRFVLELSFDLPKDSFIFDGSPYDVPCCFQIWSKTDTKRKVIKEDLTNDYFDFVSKDIADFAIRRVGGNTGKVFTNIQDLSVTSNYFLKYKHKTIPIKKFLYIIECIDYSHIINNTAGVRSLSKNELIMEIRNATL